LPKKIIIIDNTDLSYDGEDINGKTLRGTETSLILLSQHLVKKDINVDYCTNTSNEKIVNNVKYLNKKKIDKNIIYDLAIAISDSNQFDLVKSKKRQYYLVITINFLI
jgi:hypothetical protein